MKNVAAAQAQQLLSCRCGFACQCGHRRLTITNWCLTWHSRIGEKDDVEHKLGPNLSPPPSVFKIEALIWFSF